MPIHVGLSQWNMESVVLVVIWCSCWRSTAEGGVMVTECTTRCSLSVPCLQVNGRPYGAYQFDPQRGYYPRRS